MSAFKWVHEYTDRHGSRRRYFYLRKNGYRHKVPLPGEVGSPAFVEAYNAALANVPSWIFHEPAKKAPRTGVYLLLLRGDLVYIGSSRDMERRVSHHKIQDREFDQVFYIEAAPREMVDLEQLLIARFNPAQNVHWRTDGTKPKPRKANLYE